MKTIYFVLSLVAASVIISCSTPKDKEAKQALKNYTQFVDSVYAVSENWKTQIDTDYVEIPTDPNDPTKIRVDAIVTLPTDKEQTSILKTFMGDAFNKKYNEYDAAITAKMDKMDDLMKKEYGASKQKYEVLKN